MSAAALYETRVHHVRTTPLAHQFAYRGYSWLVDLDELPVLPRWLRPLARFEARDHLGDPQRSLKDNVVDFAAEHGLDLRGGQVLMLAQARCLGHVFNPISVFWCRTADGARAGVLVEVHNTYGERHVYLVQPDSQDRARVAKQLYVSPFNPVDGEYQLALPEPGATVDLTVTLHRPGQRPFVATLRGERSPASTVAVLRTALRHPVTTRLVAARIRKHGIWLWLRRLPLAPRPTHAAQPGVQAPLPPAQRIAS